MTNKSTGRFGLAARLAGLVIAAAGSALPAAALAQAPDVERTKLAQALYAQALTALDQKDFGSACPKLEEVVRLEPAGIGAKITLGECYEGAGKLASAWSAYQLAEAAARAAKQPDREKKAQERAAALAPRLGHLTVVVTPEVGALPGLEIQRDGVPVGPAQWGAALPADRGQHRLTARAANKQLWERVVEVADGAQVSAPIGPLVDVAAVPAGPRVQESSPAPAPVAPSAAPPPVPSRGMFIAGISVGAVGLVGLGVGTAFGVMAISGKHETDQACGAKNQCGGTAFDTRTAAYHDGNIATALFVVGGVALATGITLMIVAPRRDRPAAELAVGPANAAIRGAF